MPRRSSIAVGVVFLLGCAQIPETLEFPAQAAPSGLRGGAGWRVALEQPFGDDQDDLHCGGKNENATGTWRAAALSCPERPGVLVARLLVPQLESAGFTVASDPLEPAGDVLQVGGHVVSFVVRSHPGGGAHNVDVKIRVRLDLVGVGGVHEQIVVDAKSREVRWMSSGLNSEWRAALDEAIDRLIEQLVASVISFANRNPVPS